MITSFFHILVSLLVLFPSQTAADPPPDSLALRVISSPPRWVSGGDARLEVRLPPALTDEELTVTVSRRDVTSVFSPTGDSTRLEGVVWGLPLGESAVTAEAGDQHATLTLTNHPQSGPMFSGPQQQPFACASREHRARAALGDVLDADCRIETRVSFLYRSSETGRLVPFDPRAPRPDDLAQTTTLDGDTVDYIVRWERGTINRFIYSIAMLSPAAQNPDRPDLSAWNRRLIYYFQGGVGIGHYQGSPSREHMLYPYGLSKGYAIIYSTGTKTGTHYDLEVGGETAIMVKDRFVTAYGTPRYTVGVGGSGGGIQQYVYAQNHPGLLDAAIPQYAYPDMITQTIYVGDCELLERYMDAEVARDPESKWADWSNRSWLEGLNASDTLPNPYRGGRPGLTECINGWRGLIPLGMNPHYGTAPGLPAAARDTVEWTHFADAVQIYGRAVDGFAARTWDNVGVQYGLQALRTGRITPAEFLDLNARVGSWKNEPAMMQEGRPFVDEADAFDPHSARNMRLSPDDSGRPPAPRAVADTGAIKQAFREGLVFTGDIDIPVIDWRHYLEPILDMHNSVQSFATRQRMLDHDGAAGNHVIWFTDMRPGQKRYDQTPLAFRVIDEWMANLRAHPERGVSGNRPQRAQDSCFDSDGRLIYTGEDAWDGILSDAPDGPCTRRFPTYSTSRIVAGGPISGAVFKCHLQPLVDAIEAGVYGAWEPTPSQAERLRHIFPEGVCDFTRGDARRPPEPVSAETGTGT